MYGASIIIYILCSKRLSLLVDHDSLHEMAGRKHAANHKKKWYEHFIGYLRISCVDTDFFCPDPTHLESAKYCAANVTISPCTLDLAT